MSQTYYYPNRSLCNVIDEARKCHETRNYSYLLSLLEEMQTLGNRMEAGLADKKDIRALSEEVSKLKVERRELLDIVKQLRDLTGSRDRSQP